MVSKPTIAHNKPITIKKKTSLKIKKNQQIHNNEIGRIPYNNIYIK
jgi:hypothetical protein